MVHDSNGTRVIFSGTSRLVRRGSSLLHPLSAGKWTRRGVARYEAQCTTEPAIGVLAAYGETALLLGHEQPNRPTMVHSVRV